MADQHFRADVELDMAEDWAGDPLPPVLEQAKLGDLGLFQEELRRCSHPLDFRAGPAVYSNRTPLHLAAMHGHHEIVQFILNHPGISREVVNAKDCFGYTPLHLAIRAVDESVVKHESVVEQESVVKLLTGSLLVYPDRFLTASNEPDDLDGSYGGYTPLHFAALKESLEIARLLLRQPCQLHFSYDPVNIRATTWHGHTSLDIARQKLIAKHLDGAHKKKIEELMELLEGSDENWLQQERERNAMSANAILVGAALVAAAAFGSWLQPPGGIPTSDSASSSGLLSSGSVDKNWNSIFYLFVAFAFSFSVIALVIGTLATVPYTAASLIVEVQQLRRAVKLARRFLVAAILTLIYCFAYAGSLVLDKVATVNGKFSNARFKIIAWLPSITYLYIAYYETSYKSRMDGVYGKKLAFSTIALLLLGVGVGFVTLTVVDNVAT